MATAAASTAPRKSETNENFNIKACLNDLTKIPQKEFEEQFRNWMEKDGVARAMQAKLRADLIANFNKTNLGKHIIGQTPTNRLTLSPMEMALNTLVAEFLFAHNCHFSLSVYSTEAPFRNTLPDFDSMKHFRFKEHEITEIVKAICGPLSYDWNIKNKIMKNYATNKSTALLYFVLKVLLDKSAETTQHKVSVGTNTKPFKIASSNQPHLSSDLTSSQQARRNTKGEFYNTNFRHLNRYLIILSRKVKDMSERFEQLQYGGECGQPRVRAFKSMRRRKYEDLNRSLEQVTENLKQMANSKLKSKRVGTIVKAIEVLAAQFQKCAENFEHVSKDLKISARSKAQKSTTSSEAMNPMVKNPSVTTTTAAASQTDMCSEKSFVDWLHEMRYTRNGQKFLDRIEKSFLKALEKQKRELLAESEVKLRHQRELMRIRYKQKVLQEICSHGSQSAYRNESNISNIQPNETISEQFRQFELKHFDLLSKIYESETDHKATDSRNSKPIPQKNLTSERVVHFNVKDDVLPKSSSELESYDMKLTSSSDTMEPTPPQTEQDLKEKRENYLQQQVKAAIGDIVAEERNVDQIVMDAKLRIRELEHEGNQLTENFLGYLDRQREQKLAAREAAQSLWNDYMNERDKMQERYNTNSNDSGLLTGDKEMFSSSQLRMPGDAKSKQSDFQETLDNFLKEYKKQILSPRNDANKGKTSMQDLAKPKDSNGMQSKDSGSESSSSYMELKNPIIQAKENFFERERQFKAENSKQLLIEDGQSIDFDDFLKNENFLKTITGPTEAGPLEMPPRTMPWNTTNSWLGTFFSESLSGSNIDLSSQAGQPGIIAMASAATSNIKLAANWQGSLERPQNDSENKSRRREIIATAKEAMQNQRTATTTLTTNAILAAAAVAATTQTTRTTLPRALNKNNADGASAAEAQQEHSNNYKIKNGADYGQKHILAMEKLQQQSESCCNNNDTDRKHNRNNNKTSSIKLNATTEVQEIATETSMSVLTAQTWKPSFSKPKVGGSNGNELSRRAVLKQTMARMQQLFSPHPQQQQQHQQEHQKQQIMLADVNEEEENNIDSELQEQQIEIGKEEKSWQKKNRSFESITNNNDKGYQNFVVFDADSENAVGHYKNNFLSTQYTEKETTADDRREQKQKITQIPTTSMGNIHEQRVAATATAVLIPANRQTSTALHSIDDGNKTVEALVDWQQIACGPSGRQNEARINVDKIKVLTESANITNLAEVARRECDSCPHNEYDEDEFENDIKYDEMDSQLPPLSSLPPLPQKLGEIFERNQTSTELTNQAEIGELIEHSDMDDDAILLRAPVVSDANLSASEVSSIDLQLNTDADGASSGSIRVSNRFNMSAPGGVSAGFAGSDSGSDFWA